MSTLPSSREKFQSAVREGVGIVCDFIDMNNSASAHRAARDVERLVAEVHAVHPSWLDNLTPMGYIKRLTTPVQAKNQ